MLAPGRTERITQITRVSWFLAGEVVQEVHQDVRERVGDLGGRAKLARVVVVREHGALAPHDAVQRLGDADAQPLHAPCERPLIRRLDDQVDMVPLHGEVDQAEPEAVAAALEALADAGEAPLGAQIPDVRPHPPGHVHRVPRRQRRPASVRHFPELARRFARAPALPSPPPAPRGQVQLHLLRFPLRRRHPAPPHAAHRDARPVLLGDRFYGGSLTFRATGARRRRSRKREDPSTRLRVGGETSHLARGEISQRAGLGAFQARCRGRRLPGERFRSAGARRLRRSCGGRRLPGERFGGRRGWAVRCVGSAETAAGQRQRFS